MRKVIAFTLSVALLFSISYSAFASDTYNSAINSTLLVIDFNLSFANYIATHNIMIWEKTGTIKYRESIDQFLKYGDTSLGNPQPSPENMSIYSQLFGSSVLSYATLYYQYYNSLTTDSPNSTEELIKQFKNAFPNHIATATAIQDYNNKIVEYANFIINYSDNLINYYTTCTSFQEEIRQLRKNIESAK